MAEGRLGTLPPQSTQRSPNKLGSSGGPFPSGPVPSHGRNHKQEEHLTRVTFLSQNRMEAASRAPLQRPPHPALRSWVSPPREPTWEPPALPWWPERVPTTPGCEGWGPDPLSSRESHWEATTCKSKTRDDSEGRRVAITARHKGPRVFPGPLPPEARPGFLQYTSQGQKGPQRR